MSNRGRHKKVRDKALRECSCKQLDYMMAENRAKEQVRADDNRQSYFLRELTQIFGDARFLTIPSNGRIYDYLTHRWFDNAEQAYHHLMPYTITYGSNTSTATYILQYNSSE